MTNLQLVLTVSIPSLLVILSWVHNNTRLSRLEAAGDALAKRMDDFQRNMHNDMLAYQANLHADILSFQAVILGEVSAVRERVAVVEVRR